MGCKEETSVGQIIELKDCDISNKLLVEFYDSVAQVLGADIENVQYDCRKICISSYMQDCIYDAYRRRYPEEYESNKIQFDTQVTMKLAISGPKVAPELTNYQVLIEEGFLC